MPFRNNLFTFEVSEELNTTFLIPHYHSILYNLNYRIMKKKLQMSFFMVLFLTTAIATAQVPARQGWWKFDDATNLVKAEIGTPLELSGVQTSVAGPTAENKATQVETGNYLTMTHGIAPNGGGTMVNEYSIQIDFSIPEAGSYHALVQTDPDNANDADLFVNASNQIGVGATGYSSKVIAANVWYRLVVSVVNGSFYKIYVDGLLWNEGTVQEVDGRFGLASTLILFGDEDGEDPTVICSEVGIWDVALDEDQVTQLGDAYGNRVRVRTKLGSWTFDNSSNLLKASIGSDLQLVGNQESVAGPTNSNLATKIGVGSYLKMNHGIALKGEDTLVNEYSIQIDFLAPQLNTWYAFFQTESANTEDADLFIKKGENTIGTATTTYSTNAITANTWYRMVVTVKNGEFFKVYINGELWLDATGQPLDGRWGLSNSLLLFADNDGDDGEILCSEVGLWEVALTENEVKALGSDPSNKMPERLGLWRFDDNSLSATVGADMESPGTLTFTSGPAANNEAVQVDLGNWLTMKHGIEANGGGTMVNEYSLQIDFSVPEIDIWHAFFQTDPLGADASDADLFTNTTNNIGTQATGYTSSAIETDTWYRMIITVKNGVFFKIYLDGEEWLDGAGQPIDDRFALSNELYLFGDNDGDDGTIICSEIAIWDVALTAEQAAELGDASETTGLVTSIELFTTDMVTTITTPGGTLQVSATVLPEDAIDKTVTWSVANGTGEASISVDGILTAISDGTVTVKATSNDGSNVTGSMVITLMNQTGISSEAANTVKVYPNPVVNKLNISMASNNATVTIYNSLGIVIEKVQVQGTHYTLDVSNYTRGIYFVKVNNHSAVKFVK